MKTFLSLIATILLLLCLVSVDSSVLEETCRKVDDIYDRDVDFNFCVTSLQVVPQSHNSDAKGLAIVAVKLTDANLTTNFAMTNELFNNKNMSKDIHASLHVCLEVLDLSIDDPKKAIEHIMSNDIESAVRDLGSLNTDVVTCIDAWNEGKEKPLMVKENDDLHKLSRMTLAMTSFLQ